MICQLREWFWHRHFLTDLSDILDFQPAYDLEGQYAVLRKPYDLDLLDHLRLILRRNQVRFDNIKSVKIHLNRNKLCIKYETRFFVCTHKTKISITTKDVKRLMELR